MNVQQLCHVPGRICSEALSSRLRFQVMSSDLPFPSTISPQHTCLLLDQHDVTIAANTLSLHVLPNLYHEPSIG